MAPEVNAGLSCSRTWTYREVMPTTLSTAHMPVRDRTEYWRQIVCSTFLELDLTHGARTAYRGSVVTGAFGNFACLGSGATR